MIEWSCTYKYLYQHSHLFIYQYTWLTYTTTGYLRQGIKTHIPMHFSHLALKTLETKKSVSPHLMQVIHAMARDNFQIKAWQQGLVYPSLHTHDSLPPCTWPHHPIITDIREPPPRVIKTAWIYMHSTAIHYFYHTQSSFLTLKTFLFHSAFFSHCSSIPYRI